MNLSNSTPEGLMQLELKIGEERLRQARYSFNLALTSSIAFTIISGVGAMMLWLGNVSEGAIVASSGMLSSAGCVRLAKDANDRLDKIVNE